MNKFRQISFSSLASHQSRWLGMVIVASIVNASWFFFMQTAYRMIIPRFAEGNSLIPMRWILFISCSGILALIIWIVWIGRSRFISNNPLAILRESMEVATALTLILVLGLILTAAFSIPFAGGNVGCAWYNLAFVIPLPLVIVQTILVFLATILFFTGSMLWNRSGGSKINSWALSLELIASLLVLVGYWIMWITGFSFFAEHANPYCAPLSGNFFIFV
jgi:hypothetical protein